MATNPYESKENLRSNAERNANVRAGAAVSTATGAFATAAGTGCVVSGIALTATGVLAPVGIALIIGGTVGGLLGVGAVTGGSVTIANSKGKE